MSEKTKETDKELINEDRRISPEDCQSLRTRRENKGTEYEELSEEFNVDITGVLMHVKGKCNHRSENVVEGDRPWTEEEVMRYLCFEEELSFKRMATLMDCHDDTARNWTEIHGLFPEGTNFTSSTRVRRLQSQDLDPFSHLDEEESN